MTYKFTMPPQTLIGENALAEAREIFLSLGRRALIVTGKHVLASGIVGQLTQLLDRWGISWELYSEIVSEPTDQMIYAGVTAYRESRCDFCIGIGGGSPLDSAKAIAAMTVSPDPLPAYMEKSFSGSRPPLVLIPTTAGTGSEATKFTIITDTEKQVKMLLKGEMLLPDLAVIDPAFTLTAPPSVTAATGMDALAHAVESYTSRKHNPLTDLYALSAIRRIFRCLPRSFQNGQDKKAREEMALAAYEAGICINNASVTIVHGMSRPIGALFHVPHGISNAMLMQTCFSYVMDGCPERFADIGRAITDGPSASSPREAAGWFLKQLAGLCHTLHIPSLADYGIDRKEFEAQMPKMARDALESGSPSNTIKPVTENDIITMYKNLWY